MGEEGIELSIIECVCDRNRMKEIEREGGRGRALTLSSDGSVIQVGARTSVSSFSFVSLLSLLCISKTE